MNEGEEGREIVRERGTREGEGRETGGWGKQVRKERERGMKGGRRGETSAWGKEGKG